MGGTGATSCETGELTSIAVIAEVLSALRVLHVLKTVLVRDGSCGLDASPVLSQHDPDQSALTL
jgi:hypothetical protein